MMLRNRIVTACVLCCLLAVGTGISKQRQPTIAAAAGGPQLGPGFVLPGSTTAAEPAGKFPNIAALGHTVHMTANTNQVAQYWSKQDTATSASNPTSLGETGGDTDHTQAAIGATPDGTLYAAWIVQKSSITMRRKPPSGNWGEPKTIYSSGGYMSYLDMAVTSNGQIFVVWNEDYQYRYVRSPDRGNTWSGAKAVSSKDPFKPIFIAAGGNNTVVAAFGGNDGHAYAAVWNGGGFDTADLTPLKTKDDFFAFAKPAVAPNGKIYVAFSNGRQHPGIYYTERQANGNWPLSRLADGGIYGAPAFAADAENNLHFSWSSDISGRWQLYYAFKPTNGDWYNPIKVDKIDDKYVVDVDLATTIGERVYGHTVFETFDGADGALRYQQFSNDSSVLSAMPVLDGGASMTSNALVTVSFSNLIGSPDGVRTHWDAPPTAADAWMPFANPITVSGPSITPDQCGAHTLYVQLKQGNSIGAVGQDSEIFDTGVQALVQALNPNQSNLPAADGISIADIGGQGASAGHPRYTRERQFFLGINGQNDCADLKEFSVAGSAPISLDGIERLNRRLALPDGAAPGQKTFDVQVVDKLGNQRTWPVSLIYDPANTDTTGTLTNTAGLPVLGAGGSFQADSANSVVRSLSFQGISVTDTLYGPQEQLPVGKQFWGVWLANATADVGPDNPNLRWYPVPVVSPSDTFTITWSLFAGLGYTSDLANKPGDYVVYARFLDGAGNPSQGALKLEVSLLPGYTLATQRLPLAQR